ncbi:MAG: hypothetical protein ABIV39_15065 [Verrucomicrobiota bacterium]
MFPGKKAKPKNLYYLFPVSSQGSRKRYLRNLFWSTLVGLFVSGLLALLFFLFNQR